MKLFLKFEIIIISIIYYYIVIWIMRLFSIAYDKYDDFQHVNFIFSQNFSSLLWRLFNDKINLRVRNSYFLSLCTQLSKINDLLMILQV
jgi:hypothetical protein